ncbi:MAG: phosphatidate cytidylyltransferase [Pseudomonadales bacterium]
MLKKRIITGVILALIFIGSLLLSPQGTLIFLAVAATIAGWEWGRLAGWNPTGQNVFTLVMALVLLALLAFTNEPGWYASKGFELAMAGATTLWAILFLWVISYPASTTLWSHRWLRTLLGLLLISFVWLALAYLRVQENGSWLILYLVLIVVAADIGAYFTGKAIGKRKLAPKVSPGKTWEGFFGGLTLVAAVSLVVANLYGLPGMTALQAVILSIVTAAVSAVGDLSVSMFKREANMKDSSNLLPGHGGVLDRVDSILAAGPMFAFGLLMAAQL